MAATFDPALSTLKDHIRLALGDKDTASPLLADETIAAKLSAFSYCEALAQLAEALIAEFGQRPDDYSETGGIHVKWGERIDAWRRIAEAARNGEIATPDTATRTTRHRAAIQELSRQAQTPATPRTSTGVPTLMEGFRSD